MFHWAFLSCGPREVDGQVRVYDLCIVSLFILLMPHENPLNWCTLKLQFHLKRGSGGVRKMLRARARVQCLFLLYSRITRTHKELENSCDHRDFCRLVV